MAEEIKTPTKTGETVTVACKMPHGLELRVFDMVDKRVIAPGGSGTYTVKEAVERKTRVRLNGFAHPQDKAAIASVVGGYGLTFNVDKAFFDLWMEQNKDSDVVQNGLIFAHVRRENAEGKAREQKELKSGLERLDPAKPPPGIVPLRKNQDASL